MGHGEFHRPRTGSRQTNEIGSGRIEEGDPPIAHHPRAPNAPAGRPRGQTGCPDARDPRWTRAPGLTLGGHLLEHCGWPRGEGKRPHRTEEEETDNGPADYPRGRSGGRLNLTRSNLATRDRHPLAKASQHVRHIGPADTHRELVRATPILKAYAPGQERDRGLRPSS